MILKTQVSFAQNQSFVLKLHRDAVPAEGRLMGRLEHVVIGKQYDFNTVDELIACLVPAVARVAERTRDEL